MSILALDKLTVKQITTAQVITTVFSVVKELVENSLDGGANNVEVFLEDKGVTFIEVKDNGSGISKADATFMALASYTSKISNMNDLESLQSYGFRGEALNAMCQVADVKVITRTIEDDHARCYTLAYDGTIEKAEFCNRAIGTTVQVRSLFKRYPVRKQVITQKKQSIEGVRLVENLLRDFAMCRPSLKLSYRVDDAKIFSKISTETQKENLAQIYGKKFAINYIFLNSEDKDLKLELIVPKKDLNDLSSITQINYSHIFVNGRPVVFKEFEKQIVKVLSAHFSEKITARKKPAFFLSITTSPAAVDVNLEPNKTAVLLVDQASIIEIVVNLLADYYDVAKDVLESSQKPSQPSCSLNDSSIMDSSVEISSPSPKKRKIEHKSTNPKTANNENVENMVHREMWEEMSEKDEELMSQRPEVNLGEDFLTQDINALPTVSPEQLERIINDINASELSAEVEKSKPMTEAEWSRGQGPNIGGTDVSILNFNAKPPVQPKPCSSMNPEANEKGFQVFSREMRPRLVKSNPQKNLVEIAKMLNDEWKQLSSDEREGYREMGMRNSGPKPKLISTPVRKLPKSANPLASKHRMLELLENMSQRNERLDEEKDKIKEKKESKSKNPSGRHIVPWEINIRNLTKSFHELRKNCSNGLIVGMVGTQWIAKTNMELWCLDVHRLFDGLELKSHEREETPEFIGDCLQRWLDEKDSMDLMHPIFEYRSLK